MRFLSSVFALTMAMGLGANAAMAEMKLTSKAFGDGKMNDEQALNGFDCTGGDISPDVAWSGAPEGTKAYALMFHDADAPTGSGWWQWVVVNIPAEVTSFEVGATGKLPGGIETDTDFGVPGYRGGCPPKGKGPHHYNLTVYALPDLIPEGALASAAMIGFMVNSMALDKATLTVTRER